MFWKDGDWGLLIRKDEMELLLSLRGAESPKIDLIPSIFSVLEPVDQIEWGMEGCSGIRIIRRATRRWK